MNLPLSRQEQLKAWLQQPSGQYTISIEQHVLNVTWNYVLGDYLLIIGDVQQVELAKNAQHKELVVVAHTTSEPHHRAVLICAEYEVLPIHTDSIDTILLPHTLEFSDDPYQVLREAEQALAPEGYLIIVGFNPFSLWGLRHFLSFRKRAPWSGSFRRAARIKDWLRLLNFELVEMKRTLYSFPLLQNKAPEKCGLFCRFCKLCLPFMGGVYVLVARKRVFGATPLKSKWRRLTAEVHSGIVQPARRGMK